LGKKPCSSNNKKKQVLKTIMPKIFLIIFIFFTTFSVSAEIVRKIELIGNDRFSIETIKVYGDIKLNKDYSDFDINNILKNLYETEFFEDIKISLNNNVLKITVQEYPVINSVTLKGEKSKEVTKKILERLNLKSKKSYIENKLTEDISTIKKIYASIGFNFSTVEAKTENFDNNRINLIYFVDKGKKTDIAKINFIGDKKIRNKRLRDIIVSEEKKFWKFLSKNTYLSYNNIELDKRLLINYYKSLGYYDVQVLSNKAEVSNNNSTNLTYTINAGNRYKIYKISTNVSDVLDKKTFVSLQKDFTKVVGKYYSPLIVKKLLDDLEILIADNDLQFIEHSVNEILENDSIEIKINIFEGKKVLVEKINIIGNTVTDESVIRSELLLDEGDPFSSLKLDQSIAKMKSRNLFASVKKKITSGENSSQKVIEIEVEEQPTGEITAGAGLSTAGGSFSFGIKENNWLGKGLRVETSIDASAETFTGGFSLTDPNYKYSGNSLNYFATNTSNDKTKSGFKNNLITLGIGTGFEQYKDVYLFPQITYSYDDLKVSNTASSSLKKQNGTFSDLSFDYSISLDKRNRAYAPTDGYISRFSQALPIYADSPYIKNSYNFSKYKSFSPNAIGSFKLYASAINGLNDKDVRLSKRIGLPTSKLRGFEAGRIGPKDGAEFVGGNYAYATNFEMALPNLLPENTKLDIAAFLDFGNLWNIDYDSTLTDTNKIRSTTGVATSWTSPIGPMTFILSQNISKASTDIVETFNFRLGTTF
jgi:outer membrane protein insertion porin family